MKINRRERIGISVFLVALLALAVDRLLLTDAEPRAAAAAQAPSRLASAADLAALQPQPLPSSAPDLVENVFAWARVRSAGTAPATEVAVLSEFQQQHQLEGVVLGPRPAAVISGRVVHLGGVLNGFRLEEVSRTSATFVADQQRVTLTIRRPAPRR